MCVSCKQPHPGIQTYVCLLVPMHIIVCGTNHTKLWTIYNFYLGITHWEHLQMYWNNKKCTSLWTSTRSFTYPSSVGVHLWPSPSPSKQTSFMNNPLILKKSVFCLLLFSQCQSGNDWIIHKHIVTVTEHLYSADQSAKLVSGYMWCSISLSKTKQSRRVSSTRSTHRHQSWGHNLPRFSGGGHGVSNSPWNIVISYNVKKYEMRMLFKVLTLQK